MKKDENIPQKFETLSEIHRAFGLPQPHHPLITLLDNSAGGGGEIRPPRSHVLSFYKISYKTRLSGRIKYGQGFYDFDEGGLVFAAPGQIIGGSMEDDDHGNCSEFTLLIHPDFLLSFPLARKIKSYGFFSYAVSETLHLSGDEKETIVSIFHIIRKELTSRIDEFSQDVIVAQVDLLLNYASRFYKRQFITRKIVSNDLLQRFEGLLDGYFSSEVSLQQGVPTVQYFSDRLNISASYLSDMLRSLTGQGAQQHIHDKLIEKAKEKLSTTNLTVSEVAYELGFEHPQSFSKLFKTKTNDSPLAFRQRFR